MMFRSISVAMMVAVLGFMLPMADAEAKRLGGGSSFGGKKSFSSPQKRSTADSTRAADARPAPANGAAAGSTAAKGGMAGGMLGGLLAGGLLGALFFGGAFENIQFMDILIFGLIAFLLFKLLARRRPAAAYAGGAGLEENHYQRSSHSEQRAQGASAGQGSGSMRALVNRFSRPGQTLNGFEPEQFLSNAKSAFEMLQQAWDSGELAELRGFTTDAVFAELQQQFQARSGDNSTEIMQLDAQLLRTDETAENQEASVMFTAMLREIDAESGLYPEPHQVEEIWHFIKPKHAIKPTWYLDGIQQLED